MYSSQENKFSLGRTKLSFPMLSRLETCRFILCENLYSQLAFADAAFYVEKREKWMKYCVSQVIAATAFVY